VKVKKMTNNHPTIFRETNVPRPPKFPFDGARANDVVDDDDDCIICGKLLLNHSEDEANECYSTLTKKQIFRKELAKNDWRYPRFPL